MATKTSAERREHFETSSGIELPNDFNPSNTDVDYERDLGEPGEFPLHARRATQHVSRAFLDDASVCGLCDG